MSPNHDDELFTLPAEPGNLSILPGSPRWQRFEAATAALTGLLASHTGQTPLPGAEQAADLAADYADALLRRLGRE